MSFEKDVYKIDKIIAPQCKDCIFFKNTTNEIICTKLKKKIDYKILDNEIKCNYKE